MSRQRCGDLALALCFVTAAGCGGVVGVPQHGAARADAGRDAAGDSAPVDAGADAAVGGWWTPETGPCSEHLQCSQYMDGFCFGGKCCIGYVTDDGGCFCGEHLGCPSGQDCCADKTGYLGCHTDCFK